MKTPSGAFRNRFGKATAGLMLLLAGGWIGSAAEPAYTLLAYNSVASIFNPETMSRVSSEMKPASAVPESPRFSAELTLTSEELSLNETLEPGSHERFFGEVEKRGDSSVFGEGSMMLLQTRLATRFSYRSWAGLHSGYGRIFSSPDTIGRSRTNGAGVDDPACVYLKMSFNFW